MIIIVRSRDGLSLKDAAPVSYCYVFMHKCSLIACNLYHSIALPEDYIVNYVHKLVFTLCLYTVEQYLLI